ncbi:MULTISPECIES: alpha/beta fold hydrolase [Inquilinus]|uniref:Pimeloyl-ACP methyl ester carboxylesterase n=1 Tax=Inquilinus ginsengisoli TaxID=363840 RepID=A0ABU1JV16_9PROT|nr:alpha/beta hydrolase [Inquilinus ginsengisoli]MDR6291854.1 pimeloyl-ACP methyl ester carboxylesterase [Inquilinus ginsengisoli]
MSEKTVRADGVEIATEAFGDPTHSPVLLIMGAMASMLWWPDEFCRRLAGQGRHVIRYDNRDTGLSTTYPPGEPPYGFDDMAEDAIRVLDGYGLRRAHLVGMSAGGMIAQFAALAHPARIASLTAISSTPVGVDRPDPPETAAADPEDAATGPAVDWSDRGQAIDAITGDARMIAGSAHPHDAAAARRLAERDYDRARNFASATNHFLLKGGERWRGRLGELQAPLLVIHGTADPIFPVERGAALANAVVGARLVRIDGGGHELHPDDWDLIIAAMAEHTAAVL